MRTVFRKLTNGLRSVWGQDLFATVRSIVNTGKRQGLSAYRNRSATVHLVKSLKFQ
jgi:transposase